MIEDAQWNPADLVAWVAILAGIVLVNALLARKKDDK